MNRKEGVQRARGAERSSLALALALAHAWQGVEASSPRGAQRRRQQERARGVPSFVVLGCVRLVSARTPSTAAREKDVLNQHPTPAPYSSTNTSQTEFAGNHSLSRKKLTTPTDWKRAPPPPLAPLAAAATLCCSHRQTPRQTQTRPIATLSLQRTSATWRFPRGSFARGWT